MEPIINKRAINLFITIIMSVVVVLTVGALILYYCFVGKNGISDNPANWGLFGDYFGGVVGAVFSLMALVFSLMSIYVSLQIATRIHANELAFQEKHAAEQKEIIQRQGKPFPYFRLSRRSSELSIKLQNLGLGPLIVNSIRITYCESTQYENFHEFVSAQFPRKDREVQVSLSYGSDPNPILEVSGSKTLLRLRKLDDDINDEKTAYRATQNLLREKLKDCEIELNYRDIFDNDFSLTTPLSRFAVPITISPK